MQRRTSIIIDDGKLADVQEALGTRGVKETVDRAFDEVLRARLRERLIERIHTGKGIDRSEELFRQTRPAR